MPFKLFGPNNSINAISFDLGALGKSYCNTEGAVNQNLETLGYRAPCDSA